MQVECVKWGRDGDRVEHNGIGINYVGMPGWGKDGEKVMGTVGREWGLLTPYPIPHQFTRDLPPALTTDSPSQTLKSGFNECIKHIRVSMMCNIYDTFPGGVSCLRISTQNRHNVRTIGESVIALFFFSDGRTKRNATECLTVHMKSSNAILSRK